MNYNLIGEIIGYPMLIIGVIVAILSALELWAALSDIKVKMGLAIVHVHIWQFMALVLWIAIGASLVWGIR